MTAPVGTTVERDGQPGTPSLVARTGRRLVDPLITAARRRLGDLLACPDGHTGPGSVADLPGITATFLAGLRRELDALAAPVLAEAAAGAPVSPTGPPSRTARASPSALAELYPELPRLLSQRVEAAVVALAELLHRFAADRATIVADLLDGVDQGRLIAVTTDLGDRHSGRSVALLRMAGGARVVYKPRDLGSAALLTQLIGWVNTRLPEVGLRTAPTVVRDGYGWMGHVANRPLRDPGQAASFYRRYGVLLALLYATGATDMHPGNMIADGAHPVLVDAETLLHPVLPGPGILADPAAAVLATSVQRTCLLPTAEVVLAMAGSAGGAIRHDLPWWNGPDGARHPVGPQLHQASVVEGFRAGYRVLSRDRASLAALLVASASTTIRIVPRPTGEYNGYLLASVRPAALRSAEARDRVFDGLADGIRGQDPRRLLLDGERLDLGRCDIPLFSAEAGSLDVETAAGLRPGLLRASAVDAAMAVMAGLGHADRCRQEWVIAASLATLREDPGHDPGPADPGPVVAGPAGAGPEDPGAEDRGSEDRGPTGGGSGRPRRSTPNRAPVPPADELIAAAVRLAEQTMAMGERGAGRLNWLGLQRVEDRHWLLLPMGAGLGDGYLGAALFLAQTAAVTGEARYAEAARLAVAPMPALLAALRHRPDLVSAIGCGWRGGFGGIGYGLARLAGLLGDGDLAASSASAVDLAAVAVDQLASHDQLIDGRRVWVDLAWQDGVAGCVATMLAVHRQHGSPVALRVASTAADLLAAALAPAEPTAQAEPAPSRVPAQPPPRLGPWFADGLAGIATALLLAADTAGQGCDAYRRAANAALAMAVDQVPAGPIPAGWCRGAAGMLAAVDLAMADATAPVAVAGSHAPPANLRRRLITAIAEARTMREHALCHGAMGVLEPIADRVARQGLGVPLLTRTLAAVGDGSTAGGHAAPGERPAGRALRCATPGAVPTPGLLGGLAGVGYGLLRMAAPSQVPSVLLAQTGRSRLTSGN